MCVTYSQMVEKTCRCKQKGYKTRGKMVTVAGSVKVAQKVACILLTSSCEVEISSDKKFPKKEGIVHVPI